MRIAIACDHVAVDFKKELIQHLEARAFEVKDFGVNSTERADYPVYAKLVAEAVAKGECERGVLVCGTGVGMSLAANKINGIRAVVCSEPYSARLSREHNLTNVLCMGARVIGAELAKMILDAWLDAEFIGGRHRQRVDMITALETK